MAHVLFESLTAFRFLPGAGAGYIAGIAPGVVTANGSPASRIVEARHRLTRVVHHVRPSAADGTYIVHGVDPADEFDIIGRDWTGAFNDVIISRLRPEPYDVTSATGSFAVNDAAKTLDGAIDLYGGIDHVVTVSSGTAPTGITFSVVGGGPPTYAYASANWLIASGTAAAGSYTWELSIASGVGVGAPLVLPMTAEFT